MKRFLVFENPQGQYEAVKQGWSWPAFIFTGIWALFNKMWGIACGLIIVSFLLAAFVVPQIRVFFLTGAGVLLSEESVLFVVHLVYALVIGANGNKWKQTRLFSRGFEQKDVVLASNKDLAIAQYIKELKR